MYDELIFRIRCLIPDAEDIHNRASEGARRTSAAGRRAAAKAKAAPAHLQWDEPLARRVQVLRFTDEEKESYENAVIMEREWVMDKKFFPNGRNPRIIKHAENFTWRNPITEDLKKDIKDVATNDTGLPAAGVSATARMLEQWCKLGSWAICKECNSIQKRSLTEVDTRRVASAMIAKCDNCKNKHSDRLPKIENMPEKLKGLSEDEIHALRPLDIDAGPWKQADHGFRYKTGDVASTPADN